MHELSICQSLLSQLEALAAQHHSTQIYQVRLQIGPLAGIDTKLLQHAFPLAVAGTIAQYAQLHIEQSPIMVKCRDCKTESNAQINKLICGNCGSWQVQLISGDELLLESVELDSNTNNEPQRFSQNHDNQVST